MASLAKSFSDLGPMLSSLEVKYEGCRWTTDSVTDFQYTHAKDLSGSLTNNVMVVLDNLDTEFLAFKNVDVQLNELG